MTIHEKLDYLIENSGSEIVSQTKTIELARVYSQGIADVTATFEELSKISGISHFAIVSETPNSVYAVRNIYIYENF